MKSINYVVNLKRSPQRLENFDNCMRVMHAPYVRIDAIDARNIPSDELHANYNNDKNKKKYFAPLKDSEIACFLSHRKAWATFLENNDASVGVFFEDDVELLLPYEELVRMLDVMDWDSSPIVVKLYQSKKRLGKQVKGIDSHNFFDPILPPLGMQAQAMNRSAAALLFNGTREIYEPVDVAMQRWWNLGIKVFVLCPNAIREVSENLGGSTLSPAKRPGFLARLAREIRRPIFRLKMFIRSWYERSFKPTKPTKAN